MTQQLNGRRVYALASANGAEVISFGSGTYVGDEIPPPEVNGPFGKMTKPNPKIVLDRGGVVWGCECWWAPEGEKEKILKGRPERFITPEDYRTGNF